MEIYKELKTSASKEFEKLLNAQLSKTKIEEGKIIEGRVTKITASKDIVWAHCSNKECGDYTQMYRIPNSALPKRVCIRCASHLKKTRINFIISLLLYYIKSLRI